MSNIKDELITSVRNVLLVPSNIPPYPILPDLEIPCLRTSIFDV